MVDASGGPLSFFVAGANINDHLLLDETLSAVVVPRSGGVEHLCLDKGYDNPTGRSVAEKHGYVPHIKRIGEEKLDDHKRKRHPARRWVVERTFSWLSRCRAILTRFEKNVDNYIGLLQLACALLWYRRLQRCAILR